MNSIVDKIKKRSELAIMTLVLIVLGLYFLIEDASNVKKVIFIVVGAVLIVLSVLKLLGFKNNLTKENVILPAVTIVIGVILIFFGNIVPWLFVICGIYILVEPCINIYRSKNRQGQLSLELPKVLLGGLLILLAFDAVYAIVFSIAGVLAIVIGVYLGYCIINEQELVVTINKNAFRNNQEKKQNKKREDDDIIDVE